MDPIPTLFFCVFFAAVILKLIWRPSRSTSIPGPKLSFPILGHLPLLGKEPYVTFLEWKKLYGPIFAIKMGLYDVIVLNELEFIKEAFSRPEFSGRPTFDLYQTATQGKGIVITDGPLVEEQRNFAHKCLRGFGFRTNVFEDNSRLELNQVLEDIEKKCGRPVAVKGMFAIPLMSAIWNIFMGNRFDHDDPQLRRIAEGVAALGRDDGPLAFLSLFIPAISKLMPELCARNKRIQAFSNVRNLVKEAFDEPLPPTGTFGSPQNFKEAFIDEMERVGDNLTSSFHPSQNFFQCTAGDVFMASMETSSTTLDWLLLYMAKHPVVQKKVQAEIDDKIGTTRPPSQSDKDNTPYIEAVIQELLRLASVVPLGVMHRAMENAQFRGYKIKKDTLIIGNIYGVHYDEHVWGDPKNFRPERFINESGTVDRSLMRTMMAPFSTGKRSCVGENLARDQIYLFCTGIFQRFNVSCHDQDTTLRECTAGTIRGPKDFKLTFTKRFAD